MCKRALTVLAILSFLVFTGAASAAVRPDGRDPLCSAYLSLGFGGSWTHGHLPLHYGFMMRYDNPADNPAWGSAGPPLFMLDFDTDGHGIAAFSGLPFLFHFSRPRTADSLSFTPETVSSSLPVLDWGLLGLGISGAGYWIDARGVAGAGPGLLPAIGASHNPGAAHFAGAIPGRMDGLGSPSVLAAHGE